MFNKKYYYLFKVQYLGYRFHGWQKQPNLKTVHLMIDRTLKYILDKKYFKTLGSGRTDAMVSAESAAFELFLKEPIEDTDEFLKLFNHNLPQDIRALSMVEVGEDFNIINDSKVKEYHYLFAHGDKFHPFCAPIMTTILEELDIDLMARGCRIFEGNHNFKAYCYRANMNGLYNRSIIKCELSVNDLYTANFFPDKTYILKVTAEGFGRNQIRLMMGVLIELGRGDIDLNYISNSLKPDYDKPMTYIAPASGLILHNVEF